MKIKISIILLVLLLLSGCGTGKKSISHSLLSLDEFNNRFIFPERLGQLKKVDITNYEKDHPGGGYSVIYESSNTRLDIFAYDQRIVDIPPDIRSELVVNEFKYSANAVFEMVKRENYKNITSSKGRYISLHDHDFWIAEFEFTVNGLDRYSVLALTVHRQKIFKLRITKLKDKSISYKNIVNELIDEVIWKILKIEETDQNILLSQGLDFLERGQYDKAITIYNKAIELYPKNDMAYNSLAWLYATAKEETFRDGQMAIEYAIKSLSVEITSGRLDTLAAAYAENGDFTNAVMTEKEALKICSNQEAKKEIEELIKAYQARKTYVQYKYGEQLENR